jgi:hypothetical protein
MAEEKGTGQHKHKSSEEPARNDPAQKQGSTKVDQGTSQRSSTTTSSSSQHSSKSSQSA